MVFARPVNSIVGWLFLSRGRLLMANRLLKLTILSLTFLVSAVLTIAQPRNLLQNPNADLNAQYWQTNDQATVETTTGNNLCFVVRNGGSFYQDVTLLDDAVGQFALLIGRGSSERINPDGAITGLPHLYGYMMAAGQANRGRILDYLQGQRMLGAANQKDEWADMWGIFRVPEGTKTIRFFLNQALRQGLPHNGSAARFDNVGLYLFPTKEDAQAFANGYH
jgi:hypothetical protein